MRGTAYDGGRRFSRRHALRSSLLLAGAALVGCSGQQGRTGGELLAWPAEDRWPDRFWHEPAEVREAYRFAAANPEVLQWMPCFCGCGTDGHRSNADCYVRERRADGSVLLDPMSFG
jgi:hypothetical protein